MLKIWYPGPNIHHLMTSIALWLLDSVLNYERIPGRLCPWFLSSQYKTPFYPSLSCILQLSQIWGLALVARSLCPVYSPGFIKIQDWSRHINVQKASVPQERNVRAYAHSGRDQIRLSVSRANLLEPSDCVVGWYNLLHMASSSSRGCLLFGYKVSFCSVWEAFLSFAVAVLFSQFRWSR